MGPDGAIYVVDWYNPITCHQDDSFRDPTRDKAHGRIWRISLEGSNEGQAQTWPADLLTAPIGEVIKSLSSPNTWTRYQAKRALTARPRSEVASALDAWVETLDPKNSSHIFQLYQALTSYATIEVVRPALLIKLLESSDMRVRAAATKLIGRWQDRIEDPLELLSQRIHDSHSRVRLEAVVACSSISSARSMLVASEVIDHPMDHWTEYALKQTIHRLLPHWLPAFKQGKTHFEKPKHLAFILNEIKDDEAIDRLKQLVDSGTLDPQTTINAMIAILAHGDPEDLYRYGIHPGRYTKNGKHDVAAHTAIFEALLEILETRPTTIPEEHLRPLKTLAIQSEGQIRMHAIRLIGLMEYEDASETIIRIATDQDMETDVRAAALEAVGAMDVEERQDLLVHYATHAGQPLLRSTAIVSLAQFDMPSAAESAAAYLTEEVEPERLASQVMAAFVHKAGGSKALAEVLKNYSISSVASQKLQRMLYETGNPDPVLITTLNQQTNAPETSKDYSESLVHNLATQAKREGNPQNGQSLYSKLACNACHQINGVGGMIGPDLTAIGTTLAPERIIEELMWPGRQIKEGFAPVEIHTKDDRILIGYERTTFQRPDAEQLILRDTVSTELIKINKNEIQTSRKLGSMMPEGLTDGVSEKELLDLVQYLIQLGTQL